MKLLQHTPMKWPAHRFLDWMDASARQAWIAELRGHIFNLFVLGYEGMGPRRPRGWTRERIRESLLANKQVLDRMLHLAGLPLEAWEAMDTSLPPPRFEDLPAIVAAFPSPFQEALHLPGSAKERGKWFAHIEEQLEELAAFVLVACPGESKEHRRARWAVIHLRVFIDKLRLAFDEAVMMRA